jgi:riboflavin biosynthesis pyrimidine reductase
MGGASTADQALEGGLVDEVQVNVAPVLLVRAPGCSPTWAASRSRCSGSG